jgi:hypothetical protein
MAKPLDQTTVIRLAWIVALRLNGARQCRGAYTDGRLRCALGLLREIALPRSRWSVQDSTASIGALAGLTASQAREIVKFNDGPGDVRMHTFAEIADIVERWPAPAA